LIRPSFKSIDTGDGGIRRIVEAQRRYLPEFGIDIAETLAEADVVAVHGIEYEETSKPLVVHCHGLYWSEYNWSPEMENVNRRVIQSMRRADAITVPSEWVADSLRRGMWLDPIVLPHGVNLEDWEPEPTKGYVLWNKTRVDSVCDPVPMNKLAAMALDVPFVSTFGSKASNVVLTGRTSFQEQKHIIAQAGVYLCSARETFGIGTLEAMACGVPVLGWDFGGQHDIIQHKVTGWLAPVDDYESLLEGLHYCLEHRDELGKAAQECIEANYTWPVIISQYAKLYEAVAKQPPVTVSIVVPCYNLAQYLPACIDSVLAQPFKDFEVLVVDDASPDNTAEVVREYSRKDSRVHLVRNKKNEYLAGTLNHGIHYSKGKYIVPLDADNMLGPDALTPLVAALESSRSIDIAYGAMQLLNGPISGWPPDTMSLRQQLQHHNQCPSTSMFRRKVWETIGGYRKRCRTADDADFWCRAGALGFHGAKVTNAITLIYRDRDDSMSRTNKDWPWEAWYPWATNTKTMPYGAGQASIVSHYAEPDISVIIPLGPGHC
jgi:hypothetical protein